MQRNKGQDIPAWLTVEEAARELRIGRSAAYEACRTGAIPTIRLGKLIRVPRAAILGEFSENAAGGPGKTLSAASMKSED